MRGKIASFAASVALAVATLASSASPANAAPIDIWQDADFTGGYSGLGELAPTYHGYYHNNGFRRWDSVSSLKNNTSHWQVFWYDHHCRGSGASYPAYTQKSWVGSNNNDRFSSHSPEWYQSGC